RVTDRVTGLPIAGAAVSLLYAGPPAPGDLVDLPLKNGLTQANPLATNAAGFYEFAVDPGYYVLHVEAPGYEAFTSEPFVVQGTAVAEDVAMSPIVEP